MNYYKKIFIDKDLNSRINYYLTHEPVDETDEYLHEDETITQTICFPNGIEMDIKCCGVQFKENDSNIAWTEAVLFQNGCQINYSEVSDEYTGRWELYDYDGNNYICDVEVEN